MKGPAPERRVGLSDSGQWKSGQESRHRRYKSEESRVSPLMGQSSDGKAAEPASRSLGLAGAPKGEMQRVGTSQPLQSAHSCYPPHPPALTRRFGKVG